MVASQEEEAPPPEWLLSDEEALARIEEIKVSHPNNRAAKFFSREYYDSLSAENKVALLRCVRSGTYNPESSVGCYAMRPEDYDTLRGFFAPLISDYHGVPEGAGQPSDWAADSMDLAELGLGASSARVRVGRNLATFPLPGAMTKEQRCEMEEARRPLARPPALLPDAHAACSALRRSCLPGWQFPSHCASRLSSRRVPLLLLLVHVGAEGLPLGTRRSCRSPTSSWRSWRLLTERRLAGGTTRSRPGGRRASAMRSTMR